MALGDSAVSPGPIVRAFACPSCMQTWPRMNYTLRWTNNLSVYNRVHKSHILQKNVCMRYELVQSERWGLGWCRGQGGEEQNNVMRLKMNLSRLCLSNCLFPERTQRPDTMRQEGGWIRVESSKHSSLFYSKRET